MPHLIATVIVLTNLGYTVGFDLERRCPAWVAYDLEPSEVVVTNRAVIPFHEDSRTGLSAIGGDYEGSGYDRGHMAPAADFNWSEDALRETYLLSNVCPQSPTVNRGAWRRIEDRVRRLAASGTVHVVTGPLFREGDTNRMGSVAIPNRFFKLAYGEFGAELFVVENGFVENGEVAKGTEGSRGDTGASNTGTNAAGSAILTR